MKATKVAEIKKTEELHNFLFQYQTTHHTVTFVCPAEMLLALKLRNMKIRERGARRMRYEKEYANRKRGAKVRDIEVGTG